MGGIKTRPPSYPIKIGKETYASLEKNIYSALGKTIEPKIISLTLALTNLTNNVWVIPLPDLFGDA